jgi:hypothetical protein
LSIMGKSTTQNSFPLGSVKQTTKEVFYENPAQALTCLSPCLCTSRSNQGMFCMYTGKSKNYNVLLSSVEERLYQGNCEYDLTIAPGSCSNGGRALGYIREIYTEPWPTVVFSIGPITFRKELFLSPAEPELIIKYTLEEGACQADFQFRPLLAFRNKLNLIHYNGFTGFNCIQSMENQIQIRVQDPGIPRLWITATGDSYFIDAPEWRFDIKYSKAGNETEDLYSPGLFKSSISLGESIFFSVSTLQKNQISCREMEMVMVNVP